MSVVCGGERWLAVRTSSRDCRSIGMPTYGVADDVSPAAVRHWIRDANYGISRSEK